MPPPELRGLVQTARRLIEDGQAKAMCQICFEVIPAGHAHTCDPEERAQAMTRAALLGWMPSHHPAKRAKGYSVQ